LHEIEQLIADGYEVVEFEGIEWRNWYRRQHDFVCRLKLKPQTKQTPRPRSTGRSMTPRNPAALRHLLREVMIRNRRSSVGVRFPRREAAVYHLNLSAPERELYERVTAYIRRQLRQLEDGEAAEGRARGFLRLSLMQLQRQLCSTPQAVARSLSKLAAQSADGDELSAYVQLARSIEQGRKVKATLDILGQYPGKVLIFTEYLPSVRVLRAALKLAGHEVVVFHGGLSASARLEAVRAFSRSARVMVSTHSGGEGHNLQFCHQVINFDLPWNPMRIEQRIGRVHRLGQKHEVTIFNLSATDTIEAYILELLARKIRMFELVIGELDLILGQLDDPRGMEHYLSEAWAGSKSEAELLQKIQALEKTINRAYNNYEKIRAYSDELSDLVDE
jgi:SNF2 family DNA or RNA helicase